MGGFSLATLKRHPALIPLVVIVGAGMVMSTAYLVRLAVASPEVSWARHSNPEPWNDYNKKQYKFLNPTGRKYDDLPEPPKY